MDTVLRDYFSSESKNYNNYTENSHKLVKEQENWKKLFASVLTVEGKKVLNVGCGPGTEAVILAKMGYKVTALDFCPEMVELTAAKAESEKLDIEAVQGDTEDLPFEDNTFDIIVCHYALWAFPHPQKAFDEWFRVLRSGGMLEFTGGEWTMKDYGFFRRQWAKYAFRRREKYGNGRTTPTGPMKEHLQGLWSQTAERPKADLEMTEKSGFTSINKIDKVDRRIYSGMRYVEYGFYKVHYLITALKP